MKINNKSQLIEGIFLLITIAICTVAFYATLNYSSEKNSPLSISKEAEIYNEARNLEFYAREAVKTSVSQAFADISNKPNGKKCGQTGEVVIWTSECPDNAEIKEKYLEEAKKSFLAYVPLERYSSEYLIEGNNLKVILKNIRFESEEQTNLLRYSVKYSPKDLELTSPLPYLDFKSIYNVVNSKKEDCKSDPIAGKDMLSCLKSLNIEGYATEVSSAGNYYLFKLRSYNFYFYGSEYKPIDLRFAISQ